MFAAEPFDRGEVHLEAVILDPAGGPMVALALDFWTWRRLAGEGLSDAEAAALMARAATIE